AQSFPAKRFVSMQHRDLHDVAGRSLNRHVDGFAFGSLANIRIAIVDPLERANASVKRSHESMLARLHGNFFHVTPHTFVSRIIIVDYFARLLAADAYALRQTPRLNRVGDGK